MDIDLAYVSDDLQLTAPMNGGGYIDAKEAVNGRGASGTPQRAQSKVVGHSCPSSFAAAVVSHDPRIHRGDCDWTSRCLCPLRENARAVALPFPPKYAPIVRMDADALAIAFLCGFHIA
jgi:hypothetical protein